MMNEKPEPRLRYSYGHIFKALFATIAVIWIIWQATSAHYIAKVDLLLAEQNSLRQDLETVRRAYRDLAAKTEGLFEPRLLYRDTLGEHRTRFKTHAGRVVFHLWGQDSGNYLPLRSNGPRAWISFMLLNNMDTTRDDVKLHPGERFEFTVNGKPHYVVFNWTENSDTLILAEVFELEPIYNPFRRADSLHATLTPADDG